MSLNFKQQKPTDCPICLEAMNESKSLSCGHWIHFDCVKKHFKPECPLCRTSLDIKVTGNRPENNIEWSTDETENDYSTSYIPDFDTIDLATSLRIINATNRYGVGDVIERGYEDEILQKKRRYSTSSSDSENPRGDEYDYEDV